VASNVGYDTDRLAGVPVEAVESFAGVGYFFDLAGLQPGETVLDLGTARGWMSSSPPGWSARTAR
jgi:hypothetical protein